VFVYIDPGELDAVKELYSSGDSKVTAAVERLTQEATAALLMPVASVLDKTTKAASGDPHDFHAIGGYSWPDASKPDGLPYVYRDSETNPESTESQKWDKGPYEEMTRRVAVLALAHFYTSNAEFAERAATLLRTWFLNPETRMNPNFRYAAARPGVWDGHFSGTIEGVYLIEMLDYVGLLQKSHAWTEVDDSALRAWFSDLSSWLSHSPFGRREIFTTNNHGSYLLAQIVAFSTYGLEPDRARRAMRLARRQLHRQIERDGSMPREIDRADGWFYSVYGLRAFTVLARLAEHYDCDLWSSRGAVIGKSAASLAPYITGTADWPFSRERKPWEHDAVQVFQLAARAYHSVDLSSAASQIIQSSEGRLGRFTLLGGELREVQAAGATFASTLWDPDLVERHHFGRRLDDLISRVFGVLAARGFWPGRRLP
jgi:hypothetical protein